MDNPLSSSVKSESAESGKPPDLAESLSSVEQLKILSRACGWITEASKPRLSCWVVALTSGDVKSAG